MENFAWIQCHVYTSLKQKNYACYKFACPQHNNTNRGTWPPSFIAFNEVDGMKVHFRDLGKTRLGFYEILIKDTIWKGRCFIF